MSTPQEPTTRRIGATGVHSVNRFVLTVPDVEVAQRFYSDFGLEVRRVGERLDLYTLGHPHAWASIFGNGQPKRLEYLSFGIFEDDLPAFSERVERHGLASPPHPLSDGSGLWLRNPDGVATQLVVAPKVSPNHKTPLIAGVVKAPGEGKAPARSKVAQVQPRWLSHILLFTPDVPRMQRYCSEVLGLRLSDKSADVIAFMHGVHGSDHHLVAFAKSNAPGYHHSSWDVGRIDDVGNGSEQMRNAGHERGWGVGRHVLGSNYFYYVRDPWGSYAEYSFDIDHVPHNLDWPAADHPPEDSFYVWGPKVPEDFVTNFEAPAV